MRLETSQSVLIRGVASFLGSRLEGVDYAAAVYSTTLEVEVEVREDGCCNCTCDSFVLDKIIDPIDRDSLYRLL